MKECCETGAPKKRYWHWVVLGVVGTAVAATFFMPKRYFDHGSPKAPREIAAILGSLCEYAINNNGAYPKTLQPLVTPDANGNSYLEGYNGKVPLDPWKHPYQYAPPTPEHPKPRVWSLGADGEKGGEGDAADIDSDHLREDD